MAFYEIVFTDDDGQARVHTEEAWNSAEALEHFVGQFPEAEVQSIRSEHCRDFMLDHLEDEVDLESESAFLLPNDDHRYEN